jgi:eukaryotic-like serine/threonine-protein kinase
MESAYASAHDRVGRILGGRYLLRAVLGVGGTAVVYRATAPDGRSVAVKLLHDYLCRSGEVCRRFTQEGSVGNTLEHRGTVRVLDHGQDDEETAFLVLELLEGESLEDRRVRLGGRLPVWDVLEYADQLLAVLEVAHARNIVHRDIKPSNLFVTRDGTLKVLDFGIARIVDESAATATKTGQMIGTPAFMPPEQALSRPRDVDGRTDLWSVGATMFTLLSGEHVHVAESSSEHLVKAATIHARSLARALPGVPANVEALVAKALAFEKSDRWENAAEMRMEVSRVREDPGRRIGTSTSPPPDRSPISASMPTLIGGTREQRTSDAVMSLTGEHAKVALRRSYLVPLVVASTVALLSVGALVLVLAVRTTPLSRAQGPVAVQAASARTDPPVDVPPPVVALPPATEAPSAPPEPQTKGTPKRPTRSPSSERASASETGTSSSDRTVKKTPSKPPAPSASVDVYNPF